MITFVPAAGFTPQQSGVINAGRGQPFDVGVSLQANGGFINVDESNTTLIMALDEHPGVMRATGPVQISDSILPMYVHSTGATAGTTPVRGVDGFYTSVGMGYAAVPSPSGDTSGVTDQSALANAILNAGPNSEVVFMPGTYWFTSLNLNQTGQRWIIPSGCTLKCANSANGNFIIISGTNNIIEGEGTIDGNNFNQSAGDSGITIASSAIAPIIRGGLNINNAYGHGITTSGALPNGTVIDDIFILNPSQNGIFLQTQFGTDAYDVKVRRIVVDKSSQNSTTARGSGVQVLGSVNGPTGYIRNAQLDDISVKLPTSPSSNLIGIDLWGGSGGAVVGSRVTRAHITGGSTGVRLDHGQNSQISNSTCISVSQNGVEVTAGTNCQVIGPEIMGNGITSTGVAFDSSGIATTQSSIIGGNIGGCTTYPVYTTGADHITVSGTVISTGSAPRAVYFQNTTRAFVTGGAQLIAGAGAGNAVVYDGATCTGLVSDVSVDGFTSAVVNLYSTTANSTFFNVHVGPIHAASNMVGIPLLRVDPSSASGVSIGATVRAEAFPGFRGNTSGLTNSQIDGLFPCAPYDGQDILDTAQQAKFVRSGGVWLPIQRSVIITTANGTTANPGTSLTNEVTWAIIPEMTITKTFRGGTVEVIFNGSFVTSNSPTPYLDIAILVDGASPGGLASTRTVGTQNIAIQNAGQSSFTGTDVLVFTISAGSHTIAVGWSVSSGTWSAVATRRQLVVKEY